MLPFEVDCFRPSLPHPERRRAFVHTAYRIDHTHRRVIFPIDRWSSELNAFSLCGKIDERTSATLAGSPLVANNRRSAGRGNFTHARVQHSTGGRHGGICPRFRRVFNPNRPLLFGWASIQRAVLMTFSFDDILTGLERNASRDPL